MTTDALHLGEAPAVEADRLARFRRFAFATCAATYLLIWVGGLVRVSGAGLGCPDWPRCFGRWIPPTDVSQVPPGIDPSLFNVTLAWIEYVNRLIGVSVGLLILGAALLATKDLRRYPGLLWPTWAAAILVAFQGWLGAQVVSSKLEPTVITAHMVLALIIVSLLVWVVVRAWRLEHPDDGRDARYPAGTTGLLVLLWAVALFQLGLGTHLRGLFETLTDRFPLMADRELIWSAGMPAHLHLILGIAFALFTVWVCWRILTESQHPSWVVSFGAWSSAILVIALTLIGFAFVATGIPPLVQLFHAWVASLLVGALLVLLTGVIADRKSSRSTA